MKLKNISILLFLLLFISFSCAVRKNKKEHFNKGLLWEITGKDLKSPSYIFGTFHLLNEDFLNAQTGWQEVFEKCDVVVGEVKMDSSKLQQVMATMMLENNSLDKILTKEEYTKVGEFVKEVSGAELSAFNGFKPNALATIITIFAWAKANPGQFNPQKLAMDHYFQSLAKKQNKEIMPLETMEEQTSLLFENISVERQKEMLLAMVKNKDKTMEVINTMDKCYRDQDLACLQASIFTKEFDYSEKEIKAILSDRNKKWIPQLAKIMKSKPAFIAVGAGHLPGKGGLLKLLTDKGYNVRALELK